MYSQPVSKSFFKFLNCEFQSGLKKVCPMIYRLKKSVPNDLSS